MTHDSARVYVNEDIRALEHAAINAGIDEATLMQRAGEGALAVLQLHWPSVTRVTVVCGPGSNGGDGYVLAHLAKQSGCEVVLMSVGPAITKPGPAFDAREQCLAAGLSLEPFEQTKLVGAEVIVDAIFGIGLAREVSGEFADAIEAMNQNPAPVLAIDTPSGLDTNTGHLLAHVIRADATVTFIGEKLGFYLNDGRDHTGSLYLNRLGLPDEFYSQLPNAITNLTSQDLQSVLPTRRAASHKGAYGHVLVVGGNKGMPGAVTMAGEAALRTGAGLVSVATREEHATTLFTFCPEIMAHGINENVLHDQIAEQLDKASVVVLGPGLGQDEWAKSLWRAAIDAGLPMVVDADALNLLAASPEQQTHWILTPHPGEAARLLECETSDVTCDPLTAVKALQARFGGVVVLKGAGTLICDTQANFTLCSAGNPGMATGGMGDVLSGVIGGLLAQHYETHQAAMFGVCVHATAGDRAANEGERGLMARDLMPHIRQLVNPNH